MRIRKLLIILLVLSAVLFPIGVSHANADEVSEDKVLFTSDMALEFAERFAATMNCNDALVASSATKLYINFDYPSWTEINGVFFS